MQIIKWVLGISLLFGFAGLTQISVAQPVEEKGMAYVSYGGFRPKTVDKEEAVRLAKLNAVERFASRGSASKLKSYEKQRQIIASRLDDYVLDVRILSEESDKKTKRHTVVLRATINANRLNNLLDSNSVVGQTDSDERSYMTFVFVAREQRSVKSYDARVVKRTDTQSSVSGYEQEQGSGASIEYAAERNESDISQSGGSLTQKVDEIEYDISSADGINVAMTEVFSTVGFEVVEAEYLEEESNGLVSVQAFKNDYRYGDDISGSTRRNAAKGLKNLDVPYMALGTLDVGVKDTDPSSGLSRVYVTVTGKVIDASKRFPKTVASVGPVQHAGLGPNQTVARNNALKLAATEAARELANQMNAKGIY